jgi:hypothetical protein
VRKGRKAQVPCWELPGQSKLENALWHLNYLLEEWVSPRLSASPSARVALKLDEAQLAAIRRQLADLPAIPGVPATTEGPR